MGRSLDTTDTSREEGKGDKIEVRRRGAKQTLANRERGVKLRRNVRGGGRGTLLFTSYYSVGCT